MSFSDHSRRKGAAKAQELLPGTWVLEYVVGRTGPQPLLVGWLVFAGSVALIVLSFMLTGAIGINLVPLILIDHLVCPPRALVVCDRGLAVASRSVIDGRPNRIRAWLPPTAINQVTRSGRRYRLQVGYEHLWLVPAEERRLREALTRVLYPITAA